VHVEEASQEPENEVDACVQASAAVDAVFTKHDGVARVHEAPPPDKADPDELVRRVTDRALAWLRRHRYLDKRPAEERSNEARERERSTTSRSTAVLPLVCGSDVEGHRPG
jgi:hypothetical protein